jgi:1-acyl-sn-glycerol-3-phosphate acyltransferase
MAAIVSVLKLLVGLAVLLAAALLQTAILLALLPFRVARIRSCIVFARLIGASSLALIGCRLNVTGREHLDRRRPAIYVVNHVSLLDFFIAARIMPYGTVGILKRQVVYYPILGQLVLLTGHLRIDRENREGAVASLKALADLVRRARLSIYLSPEGTRSRTGRLLPFKKGPAHLALQTGLPIVPIVVQGAHTAWKPDSLALRGGRIQVDVLPAIDTSAWTPETTSLRMRELHDLFAEHLPEDQRPVESTQRVD